MVLLQNRAPPRLNGFTEDHSDRFTEGAAGDGLYTMRGCGSVILGATTDRSYAFAGGVAASSAALPGTCWIAFRARNQ